MTLNNLSSGAEGDLHWNIVNTANDGSTADVIRWETGTGTHSSVSSRAAMTPTTSGYAVITPVKAGYANITVTHPDSPYPAKIIAKVLSKGHITPAAKKYISIVPRPATASFHNNETVTLAVELLGTNVADDDADRLVWTSEGDFAVSGAGLSATVKSTA